MIDTKVCSWLMDNADTPIRYRVARELLKDKETAKKLEGKLLDNAVVTTWLKNLKPHSPPQHHGMGWDPKYPGWFDPAGYIERGGDRVGIGVPKLLFYAQNIVNYPGALKTKWFSELLLCLDRYKTENGTYVFPRNGWTSHRAMLLRGIIFPLGKTGGRKTGWRLNLRFICSCCGGIYSPRPCFPPDIVS